MEGTLAPFLPHFRHISDEAGDNQNADSEGCIINYRLVPLTPSPINAGLGEDSWHMEVLSLLIKGDPLKKMIRTLTTSHKREIGPLKLIWHYTNNWRKDGQAVKANRCKL